MQRRSFIAWLGTLWAGCKSATTSTARAAEPLPLAPPPAPRGRPSYHVDGMPRWQHHAPVDLGPAWISDPARRKHQVAFLRNPAKAEKVNITDPDEWREALVRVGRPWRTGPEYRPRDMMDALRSNEGMLLGAPLICRCNEPRDSTGCPRCGGVRA